MFLQPAASSKRPPRRSHAGANRRADSRRVSAVLDCSLRAPCPWAPQTVPRSFLGGRGGFPFTARAGRRVLSGLVGWLGCIIDPGGHLLVGRSSASLWPWNPDGAGFPWHIVKSPGDISACIKPSRAMESKTWQRRPFTPPHRLCRYPCSKHRHSEVYKDKRTKGRTETSLPAASRSNHWECLLLDLNI
ncbi:hypothetical protein BDY21DRAFT_172164 [Lineolata rhizophorae]|uniref:Uncharacterized protein n=1 Tax=Lineolata rhizophorae TaxID=578093 RepID=A0A6A6NMF9_9PEZI|nr:hypothetical protein BDY21DRAFT_172164 [Lineolata rhizophorae]